MKMYTALVFLTLLFLAGCREAVQPVDTEYTTVVITPTVYSTTTVNTTTTTWTTTYLTELTTVETTS